MVLFMALKRQFSQLDWQMTPEPVRQYIQLLEQLLIDTQKRVDSNEERIEKLESKANQNSHNSSKPPSSDPPFSRKKRERKKSKRKKGGQKGHKAHKQQVLAPTKTHKVKPTCCTCGNTEFNQQTMLPFYAHQHIELPKIEMEVTHFILHECDCPKCGKTVKAQLPSDKATGYGPRLSAFIAEMSGIKKMSRNDVKQLCESAFGISIATGTIQKIIDRASMALCPVYDYIGEIARSHWCNYIDETSWFKKHNLHWLWAMVNERVAFYRIDPHRSKQAFEQLIQDWKGILISDSYGCYTKWIDRQTCLAHLIRKSDALTERKKKELISFGQLSGTWLRKLIEFSKDPPSPEQWSEFHAHLMFTLSLWQDDKNDAGKLARQILREIDNLWVFLEHEGVEPTNNRAERALRFGVIWRKCSLGTQSEKGNRWVERILTIKETCRLRSKRTYPILVNYIKSYFQHSLPDLSWI
jgi:transposase